MRSVTKNPFQHDCIFSAVIFVLEIWPESDVPLLGTLMILIFLCFPSLSFLPSNLLSCVYSNSILYPSGEIICIKTGLCCKGTCKEAECLIPLMYWANDLYFSHSCKNVSIARTVGVNELEKSFFKGKRQQPHYQVIHCVLAAWGSKIQRLLAGSLVLNILDMCTWNLQLFSLSDSRNMPSREAQADRNLWHLITWTPKTWRLFCFLAQTAFSLLFSLAYFGTKKKEISFIWHAFQDTKGSLNDRKVLFSSLLPASVLLPPGQERTDEK